jgi:hypothetical protein
MAIRFLDDITADGSSTFTSNVSAQDFYADSGHLMNSLCAVSAILTELVADTDRVAWNNVVTVVTIGGPKWDSVYNHIQATSAIEANQELATSFVLSNSANIITANEMVLNTPYFITDGGFI